MRRYIVLLLISGIAWAQTDFDKLVLKDGTTYFGEYSKIEEEIVYFKPQNAFTFQPISIKQIQTLLMRILLLFYNPILQIITLQCVEGYKQKTPLRGGTDRGY